ncbi:hypothetical protein KY285_011089 [Solanum tuberosum]|nr:hypothetical protein KY289_011646 [Solanum tuberosum]KAH0735382.1 hypothetical protein KY285_011089 [Solanum tuberosum]
MGKRDVRVMGGLQGMGFAEQLDKIFGFCWIFWVASGGRRRVWAVGEKGVGSGQQGGLTAGFICCMVLIVYCIVGRMGLGMGWKMMGLGWN